MKVLHERKYDTDKFEELYEKDRFIARVFAIEKKPRICYVRVNEVTKNQFQIFVGMQMFGVSKTLKRHVSNKTENKYFVNNGKFYRARGKTITPLFVGDMDGIVYEYMVERFGWIRFIKDCGFNSLQLNSVVRHKLYSRDKVLRFLYKCPAPQAELLHEAKINRDDWKKILKSAHNAENLNAELITCRNWQMLHDACELAWRLNERINLSWSVRRLNEEHDRLSKTYTGLVVKLDNEPLRVGQIFKDLNDFIGGGLITQSGELAGEGMRQKHCVVSYKSKVNGGGCAIFNYKGFTVEINKPYNNTVNISQMKGLRNTDPPVDIRIELANRLATFNASIKDKQYSKEAIKEELTLDEIDLPF